ncbi:hypothetical protein [Thermoflexibacter ruber]|uniref:Lipoprotein n=1 Tax=Thermoflexibacter ruber TaxID=1003 RepID=A0A1I2JN33_9BACT|nr:hypothetical protein [Thermoflexibacter ruber]SFF54091.1 hypothetical protein SAMN04488541_10523 [Thermoflexibacter ruber]
MKWIEFVHLLSIFLVFVAMSCKMDDNINDLKNKNNTKIILEDVFINYYESDSLQNGLVYPPILYFDMSIINKGNDSLIWVVPRPLVNKDEECKSRLYLVYHKDTLNLFTRKEEGKFSINPNDTLYVSFRTIVKELNSSFKNSGKLKIQDFMRDLAIQGNLIYSFNEQDSIILKKYPNRKVLKNNMINKADSFYIEFRNPNDRGEQDWW